MKKKAKKRTYRVLVESALLAKVGRLESDVEAVNDDNVRCRGGWQRVYRAIYPQAIDGPHLGMPIDGSIDAILRGIAALRERAGIPAGKNGV